MKKIVRFVLNLIFSEATVTSFSNYLVISSLALGLMTSAPILWMGASRYEASTLSMVSPYLWAPFIFIIAVFLFIGAPFMYHASLINPNKTDAKLMKIMSVFLGFPAGALCIGMPVINILEIPTGSWNFLIMIASSFIYLLIVKTIFKKSFEAYYPGSSLATEKD